MTELLRRMAADLVLAPAIGPELRAWREEFGLSQSELAGHLGINPSVVSDYESGRRQSPGVHTIKRLCEALLGVDQMRGGVIAARLANGGERVARSRPPASAAAGAAQLAPTAAGEDQAAPGASRGDPRTETRPRQVSLEGQA